MGLLWSIGALAMVGLIARENLIAGAVLLPVVVAALLAARPMAGWAENKPIRPVALTLAALAACAILARGLTV